MEDTSSYSDASDSGQEENKNGHVYKGQRSSLNLTSTANDDVIADQSRLNDDVIHGSSSLAADRRNGIDHVITPPTQQTNQTQVQGQQVVNNANQSAATTTTTTTNRITVSELIRTLTQPTGGIYPRGVSPKDLFDFVCKLPEDQRISKSRNHLQVLLWRDVKLGKIRRLGTGVYTVPEFFDEIAKLKRLQDERQVAIGQNSTNHYHQNSSNHNNHNNNNYRSQKKMKINGVHVPHQLKCGSVSDMLLTSPSLSSGHHLGANGLMTSSYLINDVIMTSSSDEKMNADHFNKAKAADERDAFSPRNLTIDCDDLLLTSSTICETSVSPLDLSSPSPNNQSSRKITMKTGGSGSSSSSTNKRKKHQPHHHQQSGDGWAKQQDDDDEDDDGHPRMDHRMTNSIELSNFLVNCALGNNDGEKSRTSGENLRNGSSATKFSSSSSNGMTSSYKDKVKDEDGCEKVGSLLFATFNGFHENNGKVVAVNGLDAGQQRKRSADLSAKKKKKIKKESEEKSDDDHEKDKNAVTANNCSFSTTTMVKVNPTMHMSIMQPSPNDPICFFCQMTDVESIIGHPEKLLTCSSCHLNAHPTCMGYTASLADRCRSYEWQCSECKICSYCSSADKPESLLFCDDCDRGYHMHCHEPPMLEKPQGTWSCKECRQEAAVVAMKKMGENGLGHGSRPKKSKSAYASNNSRNTTDTAKRNILIQNTVESIGCTDNNNNVYQNSTASHDKQGQGHALVTKHTESQLMKKAALEATTWSVDQVYTFICQLGFPEQAVAFRREEIDGQALLLLKRNDVLSMLSLKLGPALKIHRRLSLLQSIVLGTGEPDPDS